MNAFHQHGGLTIVLFGLLALSGCDVKPYVPPTETEQYERFKSNSSQRIIMIGDCEYIETVAGLGFGGQVYSLTHKGDCKNPIHIHNGGSHE